MSKKAAAPPKQNHGGKRVNSGRKQIPFEPILLVGQACESLKRQIYATRAQAAKNVVLGQETNISDFHHDINEIPVAERSEMINSAYLQEHSESLDEELIELGQPILPDGKPSRLLSIKVPMRPSINSEVYKIISQKFGLTTSQVKNYWQAYRKFEQDDA